MDRKAPSYDCITQNPAYNIASTILSCKVYILIEIRTISSINNYYIRRVKISASPLLVLFFDGDNNALTHSLVTNICEYFLLPTIASLPPDVSCNNESIFLIPVTNSPCFLFNSSKAVLNLIGDIDEICCLFC